MDTHKKFKVFIPKISENFLSLNYLLVNCLIYDYYTNKKIITEGL